MNEVLSQAVIRCFVVLASIVGVLFTTAGCASTQSDPIDVSISVDDTKFIPQPKSGLSFSPVSNGIGEDNLKKWHSYTGTPETPLAVPFYYGHCGLVDWLPQSPAASWQLTTIRATTVYVPIFDIEAMRTGTTSRNETVYYYFKLVEEVTDN